MVDRDRPSEVNGRRGLVELYAGLVRRSREHGDHDRPGAVTLPDGQRILACGRQVYALASHWFEAVVPDRVEHVGRRSVGQPLRRNHRRSRGLNRNAMAVARPDARAGNLIAPGVPLRDGANGCFRDRGPSGLSGDRLRQFLDLYETRRIQRNADAVRLVAQHQCEEPAQSLGALVWPPRWARWTLAPLSPSPGGRWRSVWPRRRILAGRSGTRCGCRSTSMPRRQRGWNAAASRTFARGSMKDWLRRWPTRSGYPMSEIQSLIPPPARWSSEPAGR